MIAAVLLVIAFALTVSAWPLRKAARGSRLRALLAFALVLCGLPWLAPDEPIVTKAVLALGCVGLCLPKLYDFVLHARHWRQRTFLDWLAYLPNIFVLVDRLRRLEPQRSRADAIAWTSRGLVEVAAGAALMYWAFTRDFGRDDFWLEHGVKLLASYLLVFDGGFVLATGLCRLVGFRVMDLSRHPALAPTPAAFWRRYNREAGRFLHEHVFVPCGGRRRPVRGVLLVFIVNGLLHEYLALVLTGHVRGYQTTFFLLHGITVAATFRWKLHGPIAVVGRIATVVFLYFTTILFFMTVDELVPWYESR